MATVIKDSTYHVILTSRGLNTKVGEILIKKALSHLQYSAGTNSILLIVPDDYPVHDKLVNACKNIGFSEKNIYLSCADVPDTYIPSVCYVTEGNTFEVLDYMRRKELIEPVMKCMEKGGVFIGSSAGAMIASRSIGLAKDFDSNFVGMSDFSALGLLGDMEVVPHYTYEQLQRYISSFGYDDMERNITNVADDEALIVDAEVIDSNTYVRRKKRIRERME